MPKLLKLLAKASAIILFLLLTTAHVLAIEDVLFSDNFSDGNLDGWTIESGNWFVNNGNLVGSKSGRAFGGRINTGSSEWDNYAIELDVNNQQGIDEGIGFRYTPGGGSYEFNLRHGTGLYDTPEVKLFKFQNDTPGLIYSTHNLQLLNNRFYHVRIEVFEENIKLFIDGIKIVDFTDTGTNVKKGILTLSYWTGDIAVASVRFDNIKVTAIAPISTKTPLIIVPGIAASLNMGVLTDRGDTGWKWMVTAESGWRQFIDSLEKAGYQKDKDYFIAFYDWRKTNDWTDPDPGATLPAKKYLAETIDKAKAANPGITKVNVVAHSLGGLVVRSYVESPNYRNDINKTFLIGSPNSGSPFAYYTWEGAEVPPNWDPVSKAVLSVIIKLLSANFSEDPYQMTHNHIKGIKDLLPIGYDYLINNGNPFNWTNMQEINNFLKNTSNPQNTANIFSGKGVELFNITGIGQPTWEKLQIEDYIHSYLWKDGKPIGSAGTADGDNTVLTSSSNLTNITGLTVAGKHANLPNAATSLIFNKLGIAYTPSNLAGAPDEVMVAWVASPVTLTVKDSQGNSVGQSLIDPTSDMKWVFVENPAGDYKIVLTGTGSGQYHVGVDYYTPTRTENVVNQGTAALGANLDYDLNFNPQNTQPLQLAPVDKIPPVTTAQLEGTKGNNDWYLSDVNVSLSANDNEGGTGLKETKYSFDNSIWQIYTQPLTISTEGITTIYYYSSDLVGNKEDVKKINIQIDKTPPEARVYVDQDTEDLVVEGIDVNPTSIIKQDNLETKKEDDAVYTITDIAGNTLKLDVRERDKEKQDKFRIYSIQYKNDQAQILENNHFNVSYQGKKDKLNVKEQNLEIKGDIKIRIQYDSKKDKSTIIVKESQVEKVKEIKDGLVLLKLITNKGSLEVTY